MNRRLFTIFFALVSVLFLSCLAVASGNLDPASAARLQQQQPELFLLDVRTPGEYMQARLAGAYLLPIDQLVRRIDELPRDRPILVYCAVGSRSSQVAGYLVRHGYGEVYTLVGGIYAWAQQGLPVLQGPP
jgi:rhodanese-related sulfurtransferase